MQWQVLQAGDFFQHQLLDQWVFRVFATLHGPQDQLAQQRCDRQHATLLQRGRRQLGGDEQRTHVHIAGHEDFMFHQGRNPHRAGRWQDPCALGRYHAHGPAHRVQQLCLAMPVQLLVGTVEIIAWVGADRAVLKVAD